MSGVFVQIRMIAPKTRGIIEREFVVATSRM